MGESLLNERACEWKGTVAKMAKLSSGDATRRCDQALQQVALVVRLLSYVRRGFLVAVGAHGLVLRRRGLQRPPRRDIALTYQEFCVNMLLRE